MLYTCPYFSSVGRKDITTSTSSPLAVDMTGRITTMPWRMQRHVRLLRWESIHPLVCRDVACNVSVWVCSRRSTLRLYGAAATMSGLKAQLAHSPGQSEAAPWIQDPFFRYRSARAKEMYLLLRFLCPFRAWNNLRYCCPRVSFRFTSLCPGL